MIPREELTPRCDRFESCMRTLIVSRGWQTRASIMPAPPPAIKLVAAEAGFLPPGPFVVFADIFVVVLPLLSSETSKEGRQLRSFGKRSSGSVSPSSCSSLSKVFLF